MKLDSMFPLDLATAQATASALESAGYAGLWTTETPHDPYLPLALAAQATSTMTIGTAVATAFTRSPMVTALAAWDLQKLSAGRFVIGLGSQVPAHNARRYSTPVQSPGAQLRELVPALRHVWGAFQGDRALDFHSEHYRLDLLAPMHNPGPIEHPDIPIYLAAVGEYLFRTAGELADGIHVHSFHTADYLSAVALPALRTGLDRAGRSRSDVTLVSAVFAVIGGDPVMDRAVRSQIAFYGSTSAYRKIFDLHGWSDLTDRLKPLVRAGDVDAMVEAVGDEQVDAFAIVAPTWADAADKVRSRYDGILDRVGFYGLHNMVDPVLAPSISAAFRGSQR